MGFLDKFLKSSTDNQSANKKFGSDSLLSLLTTLNISFDKIKRQVESEIFFDSLIDPDCPAEYQKEAIALQEHFNKRFILSSGVTGIAIIELAIIEKFGSGSYIDEIKDFKKIIFPNILKLRNQILEFPQKPYHFDLDNEPALQNNDTSFNDFSSYTTNRTSEIRNLLKKSGEYRNILFHFDEGLGQIMPNQKFTHFKPNIKPKLENKIEDTWRLVSHFFNSI